MDALRKFLLEAVPLGRATQPTSTLMVTLKDLERLAAHAHGEGYAEGRYTNHEDE